MSFDFSSITVPFRMQPGLQRLAAGSRQLTPTTIGAPALAEKLAALKSHSADALLAAPGFDAQVALHALMEHAAQEHPQVWRCGGPWQADALALGCSVHNGRLAFHPHAQREIGECLQSLPEPWRLAGLLSLAFEEDFAILDGASGSVPWMAVCLPSHWAPEEKIGRHFTQIHAPVADNQLLLAASDHLMKLVTSGERWERFVWTLTAHPGFNAHPKHTQRPAWRAHATAHELAQQTFFRTERQTFIPVPTTQQAVFTIHIGVAPLAQAITTPSQARTIHDALASMSPAVLAYRSLTDARERLLSWLAERASP